MKIDRKKIEPQVLLDTVKLESQKILPDEDLLFSVLEKIETTPVTKSDFVRSNKLETMVIGRHHTQSWFELLIKNMNRNIKILSGGAVVAVVALLVVFTNKGTDMAKPVVIDEVKSDYKTVQTTIEVGGQSIDVDSLVAELEAVELAFGEPSVDDGEFLLDLTNSNDYEIQ